MAYRLKYSDYVTSEGPPDPLRWIGPPGPQGEPGKDGEGALVGATPPGNVSSPLWWDSNSGQLFVQYDDGSSVQWVSANSIDASTLEGSFLPLTGGTMQGPLNYTATGGTVARSAQDRAAEVINVRDYGALGNGTANDAVAIQAAANAVPTTGATLYFPKGNYLIAAPTTLKSNTVVFGPGATITAAPKASWPGGAIVQAFYATGQSNITVDGLRFVFPIGYSNFGGGAASHILSFNACTHIQVLNVNSDGGSNQTAFVGCTDTLTQGCRATNVANCCYDHWGGSTDCRVIDCYGSTSNVDAHGGMSCINFTGMNSDNSAATTTGFICLGNIVYCNVNDAQAISINGHTTGGSDSKVVIAENHIRCGPTSGSFGILLGGTVSNAYVHHNYLDTNNGTYAAIAAYGPGTNVRIEHNIAFNWYADATHGVFQNQCVGGSLVGNTAYASSSPLLGPGSDATCVIYGNGTGTNALNLAHVNISSGTASFDGTLAVTGASTLTGAVAAINGFTCGWNGAGGTNMFINSAGGNYRALHWQNAGVDRWILTVDTVDDLVLWAQADAGSPTLFTPLAISRLTGRIALSALQASTTYANDAAAAAGGIGVGQLYRNGSAVMIRVA